MAALDPEAARLALLVQYAEEMARGGLFPPLDPRAAGWVLRGHILGVDAVLGVERRLCFGFLAEAAAAPGRFVIVLRGTGNALEWIEDAEFALTPHPLGGAVEAGFWGLYGRLSFVPLGIGIPPQPLAAGLAAAIGPGQAIIVGHSLGSALATFLLLELVLAIGSRVSGCFLASPRPGDGAFAVAFTARIGDGYRLWNYAPDVVPKIPAGFDYTQLPGVQWITPEAAGARIADNPACNHHVLSYAAMLDCSVAAPSAGCAG